MDEDRLIEPLRDQSGFHTHTIGILMLIFSLIGAWYIYDSYKKDQLKENMSAVLAGYKGVVESVVSDPRDKEKVDQLFQQIQDVTDKYKR